jgi:hypothetical protein
MSGAGWVAPLARPAVPLPRDHPLGRFTLPGAWDLTGIHPQPQFFPGFEEGNGFLVDRNGSTGPRVASGAGIAMLDRESAETAQLHAFPSGQRVSDFLEDRGDDGFDILPA